MKIAFEKIQETADRIGKEYNPEKIILFGSYAWGNPTEDSDVDLFIVKETENTRDMARKIDRFVFPRQFAMDLIVYTPAQVQKRMELKDFFVEDIFEKGKVLYGNE
ncbi:nucleotidyltransferase domain-containing protein [Candidatus Azambacteria bacterium]|nr:nucleotidyltransferase domain-containing protein [Candidatus Azambacteria bacterium]